MSVKKLLVLCDRSSGNYKLYVLSVSESKESTARKELSHCHDD